MKRTLTLFFLCFSFLLTRSQLKLGIMGGPHQATVKESNNLPGWETNIKPNYSGRGGLNLGIIAEVPLGTRGEWFFHSGLLYMAKGRKYFRINDTTTAQSTDTLSFRQNFFSNYMEIPLNLVYKFRLGSRSHFLLSAGPYLSFFYNGKNRTETRTYSANAFSKDETNLEVGNAINKVKTLDLGWNARAGFELGNVLLTGFFSQGFTSFYKASYEGTFHHQVMGASLGFWLNRTAQVIRKPKDRDKDGIPDNEDACPLVPGTASAHGCPDRDGDGIADEADKCPDLSGLARYQGCPIPDSDRDGINDEEDSCINQPGSAKYHGCPVPDSDGDGINDEEDSCPQQPGIAEFNGCPIPDSDGDGLNDKEDKCPTVAGTRENNGCPEIKKEIVEKVNYAARNIFFGVNSDRLDPKSYEALNEVVVILKNDPTLLLNIGGYTDNTGNPDYNLALSQKRADAVRRYITDQGIEAGRLDATGYGQEKPLADNTTAEGRAKNRRVELKLEQH